jgi:hypothetical protein
MPAKRAIHWLTIGSALLTLLGLSLARADDGQLINFHGGDYRSDLLISNGLLFGVGSKTSALGGTCSGLDDDAEHLYWNPARLPFLSGPQAMLDLTPPFMNFDVNNFVDLNREAGQAVDDLVEEMGSEDLSLSQSDYPHVEASLGQKSLVHSGVFACPVRKWGIGLGFYQPLDIQLRVVSAGFQAAVYGQDEDDPEDNVTVSTSADMSLLCDVQVNAASFGAGRKLMPHWSLGLAIERYYGHGSANGRLQVEGIILRDGRETAFNDPSNPWPNDLHSEMVGEYQGSAWGLKLGTSFRPRHNVSLDAMLTLPTSLRLKGGMDIVQRSVEDIDFGEEEPIDPAEIDENAPTRTVMEDNPTADEMVIEVPGALKLGAAWRVKFLTSVLQYSHYWGDFSCVYGIERLETPVEYTLGMKPTDAITMGLDFKVIRLSGGLILGRSVLQRDPQKEEQEEINLLVPALSLGTGLTLGARYGLDLLLISLPAGLMRVTTSCYF